jgi:PadR family transcriptional regulator PadR
LQESQEGAPRKYYKLTTSGQKITEDLKKDWYDFVQKVNYLLEGGDTNE